MTIVLVAIAVGAIEWRWRSIGHRPSVVDDYDNWCLQREAVSNDDRKTVAVLGISRIQLGFHTATFHDMFPDWTLGFMPVEGRPPLATLRDLAEDESFKGVVICEMTPASVPPKEWDMQKPYVEHYHDVWRFDRRITRQLANQLQSNLCIVNPQLSLRELIYGAMLDEWPQPLYVVTKKDRSRLATFAMADMGKLWTFLSRLIAEEIIAEKRNPPRELLLPEEKAAQWLEWTKVYDDCVRKIQARGGNVVYVYMPISAGTLANMLRSYPRDRYWDRWAAVSPASFVHYRDYPELSQYDTPDWSHLDEKDAAPFTRSLLTELEKRGVLSK